MKIKMLAAGLAAIVSLATYSSAAIMVYSTQATVTSGQSLHMDWNPETGWSAEIGSHTGGEPLYLSPSQTIDYGFGDVSSIPPYVGSWSGTSLSLAQSYTPLDGVIDGSLSYSNYYDSNPAGGSSYYSGLRYDRGGGDYNYGWVNYSTNADSSEIILLGAAFNTTPNESILAGQTAAVSAVPEPGGHLALAGLVGCGLLLRRRTSRKAAAQA